MTRPADIPQWSDSHPLTPEIMQDPIAHKIWEIRQQVSINSQIIKREYPDNPPSVMPHTVEVLNSHINDRVAELETAIERALLSAYERGRGEQREAAEVDQKAIEKALDAIKDEKPYGMFFSGYSADESVAASEYYWGDKSLKRVLTKAVGVYLEQAAGEAT